MGATSPTVVPISDWEEIFEKVEEWKMTKALLRLLSLA